jgi:hypothetical protein
MKRRGLWAACVVLLVGVGVLAVGAGSAEEAGGGPTTTLVEAVRDATERFKNVEAAEAAGYRLSLGCVSGPQAGAMGIHFINGDLVGDGTLDPLRPEALVYELRNGQLQLLGVEYIVLAESWDASNAGPPLLLGQLLHYVGSPNRYRDPAFYELHVWAWKSNPSGTFADWNPTVTCDDYTAEDAPQASSH